MVRPASKRRGVFWVAGVTLTVIHAGAIAAVLVAPRRWLTEDRHVTELVEACWSIDTSCAVGSFMLLLAAMGARLLGKEEPTRPAVAWNAAAFGANVVLSIVMPAFGFA